MACRPFLVIRAAVLRVAWRPTGWPVMDCMAPTRHGRRRGIGAAAVSARAARRSGRRRRWSAWLVCARTGHPRRRRDLRRQAAAARTARTVHRARRRLPRARALRSRAPRAAARGTCSSALPLRVRRRQHRHRENTGTGHPRAAPSQARHETSHPQVTTRERDGIRDRPPPGAPHATSTGVNARALTTTGRGVCGDQTSGRRATEPARRGGRGRTAVEMTKRVVGDVAGAPVSNAKRPPGRARRRSVKAQPARRSGGQAQGAGVAM